MRRGAASPTNFLTASSPDNQSRISRNLSSATSGAASSADDGDLPISPKSASSPKRPSMDLADGELGADFQYRFRSGHGSDSGHSGIRNRHDSFSSQHGSEGPESPKKNSLRNTIEVMADTFAKENLKRQASIRIMLGMLCSHSSQIALLAVSTQEVLVRRVLAMLMGNTDTLVRSNMFFAWAKKVMSNRRERIAFMLLFKNQSRLRERSAFQGWLSVRLEHKETEAKKQKVMTMLLNDSRLILFNVMQGWCGLVAGHQKQLEHKQKMLRSLIGGQDSLVVSSTFASWCQITQLEKERSRTKLALSKADEAKEQSLRKASAMLLGNQSQALMSNVWYGWQLYLTEVRNIKENMRKNIGMLIGDQSRLVMEGSFNGWVKVVETTKQQMQEQKKVMKIFGGNQTRVIYKETFSGWQKFVEDSKRDLQHAQKVLGMMVGGQESLVSRSNFQAWHDFVVSEKRAREKSKLDGQYREKRIQALQQSVQKMAGASAEVMMQTCFFAWVRPLRALRNARKTCANLMSGNDSTLQSSYFREWARTATAASRKRKEGMRNVAMMLDSTSKVLSVQAFLGWRRAVEFAKKARAEDKARESKKRSMMMFAGANSKVVLTNCFQGWVDLMETIKKERESEYKMLKLMAGSQGRLALGSTFGDWRHAIVIIQAEREAERLQTCIADGQKNTLASRQKLLATMLGKQSEYGLSEKFADWVKWTLVQQKLRAKDDLRNIHKTRSVSGGKVITAYLRLVGQHFAKDVYMCWRLGYFLRQKEKKRTKARERVIRSLSKIQERGRLKEMTHFLAFWRTIAFCGRWERKCGMLEQKGRAGEERSKQKSAWALSMMFGNDTKGCIQFAFNGWFRVCEKEAFERKKTALEMEKERVKQEKLSAVASAFTAMAMQDDGRAKQTVFMAWTEIGRRLKMERIARQAARSNKAFDSALGVLTGHQTQWILRTVHVFWKNIASDRKSRLKQMNSVASVLGCSLFTRCFRIWQMEAYSSQRKFRLEAKTTHAAAELRERTLRVKFRQLRKHVSWVREARTADAHSSIYLVGGFGVGAPHSVECFSSRSGEWESLPRLPEPRCAAAACVLGRRLYVVGGTGGRQELDTGICLDIMSRKWVPMPPMLFRRGYLVTVALGGHLCACGGTDGTRRLSSAESFDPAKGTWSEMPPMREPRACAGGVHLEGRIFIAGGDDGRGSLDTAEFFDPQIQTWEFLPPMSSRRMSPAVAAMDSCVYVVGGHDGDEQLQSAERFNLATWQWEDLPPMMTKRNSAVAACCNNQLYVIGGHDGVLRQNTVERFDPETFKWELLSSVRIARNFAAVAVSDKRLRSKPVAQPVPEEPEQPPPGRRIGSGSLTLISTI